MKAWSRWADLLDRREDATPLAVARIIAGFTVFQHLIAMWVSRTADAVWVSVKFGGLRDTDLPWLQPFGGATPFNVHALLAFAIVVSGLMTFGVYSRVTVALTWLTWRTLTGLNNHSGGSSDDLLVNGLFILMFSGCGGALSFDQRNKPPALVPVWPRYVMIGQLVLVYWTTGLQKVSAAWLPMGDLDALWYIFQMSSWQRRPMMFLAPVYRLTQVGTFLAWTFENTAPLLWLAFWYRWTKDRPGRVRAFFNRIDFRSCYLAAGVMLHLGIWVTLEVGPFMGGMMVLYAACFTGEEYQKAGKLAARPFGSASRTGGETRSV